MSQVKLDKSSSLSLSFYAENNQEMSMSNKTFEFWIKRDTSILEIPEYIYTNVSNFTSGPFGKNQLRAYTIKTNGLKSYSVHIYIKSENISLGYLALLKYDQTAFLNQTHQVYDFFKLFCHSGNKDLNLNRNNF